jgi:hypothetical protein
MSMYNIIHGTNPMMGLVLALLGKPPGYFGRLRDAWVEGCEDGSCVLAVYTRNGGGNREHYNDTPEGPECDCTGCIASYRLPADPLYISDSDDDYDCTYATFRFRVPDDAEAKIREQAQREGITLPAGWSLRDVAQVEPDMRAKWEAAIAAIKQAVST